MDSKGYYKRLDVEANASGEEIKKSFRKLSMQYHPDKNHGDKIAEEKFKEINEAYSILSNPQKRQDYDSPSPFSGMFNGSRSNGMGGMDEIFNAMSGINRRRRPDNYPKKGIDLKYIVESSLSKFILGGQEKLSIEYEDVCIDCNGKGFSESKSCPNCNGSGMIIHVQNSGDFHMHTSNPCGACRGRGEIGTVNCTTCNGVCKIVVNREYDLHIEPNSRDGNVVKYNGLGGRGLNGGPPGDMYVKFRMIMPKAENLTEEQKGKIIDLFA